MNSKEYEAMKILKDEELKEFEELLKGLPKLEDRAVCCCQKCLECRKKVNLC